MAISIEDFVADLSKLQHLDDVFSYFGKTADHLGFYAFTFGLMPWNAGSGDPDRTLFISTLPDEFQSAYFEQELQKSDPIHDEMANGIVPFLSISMRKKLMRSEAGRTIQRLADEHNIGEAILIPLPSANFSRGVVLFARISERAIQALFDEFSSYYRSLAAHLAARAEELHVEQKLDPDVRLTVRELECLRLASRGKSGNAIAERLGISERTVRFHVKNAASKLGAKGRSQAIMHAVKLGLLSV